VESTTPTPYKTPGLEAATAADGSADAAEIARKLAAANPQTTEAAAAADAGCPFSALIRASATVTYEATLEEGS
jgi:hypothetical protein